MANAEKLKQRVNRIVNQKIDSMNEFALGEVSSGRIKTIEEANLTFLLHEIAFLKILIEESSISTENKN